jgi:hypothetical protein
VYNATSICIKDISLNTKLSSQSNQAERYSTGIYIITPGSGPAMPEIVFSPVDPEKVVFTAARAFEFE